MSIANEIMYKRFTTCQVLPEVFLGSARSQNVRLFFVVKSWWAYPVWSHSGTPRCHPRQMTVNHLQNHMQSCLIFKMVWCLPLCLGPFQQDSKPPKRAGLSVAPTSAVKNTSTEDYPRMATMNKTRRLKSESAYFLLTNGLYNNSLNNHQPLRIETYRSNTGLVFMKPF